MQGLIIARNLELAQFTPLGHLDPFSVHGMLGTRWLLYNKFLHVSYPWILKFVAWIEKLQIHGLVKYVKAFQSANKSQNGFIHYYRNLNQGE